MSDETPSPEASPRSDVAAAILAGGRATRMGGRPKSFLVVEGARILDRQLAVLRPLFRELFVVANEPGPYRDEGLPVVPDRFPGAGPLAGIHAALCHARADRVFVVACDMPFLQTALVRAVAFAATDADAVVPVAAGRPEPLLARYARSVASVAERRLAAGERKCADLLQDLTVHGLCEDVLRDLDPDLHSLRNFNTPLDLPA